MVYLDILPSRKISTNNSLRFKRGLGFFVFNRKATKYCSGPVYILYDFYITMKLGKKLQICCCFCFTFLLAPASAGRWVSLPELSENDLVAHAILQISSLPFFPRRLCADSTPTCLQILCWEEQEIVRHREMRKKMKGKLCIPWFILVSFWADRSDVSVHRAGLRRGNGVIKLPWPLCLLQDISRQERCLCGCCRLHCRALWADTLHFHLHHFFWCLAKGKAQFCR